MFKWLLGGPTKDFPFEIKEEVTSYEGKAWKLNKGNRKLDGAPVSVLSFDSKKNSHRVPCATNYFKKLRTLRHPNILTYLDGFEIENTAVTIVTEDVRPLSDYLQEFKEYPSGLTWGLYQLTKTIAFLNNDCKMIHGNITMENIFVTQSGDWKLGGFDLISLLTDTTSLVRNNGFNSIVANKYKSPEYSKNSFAGIDAESISCIDVWMLACLIYELYNGKYNSMEDLKKTQNIPKNLLPEYQQMLHSNPTNRLDPAGILESEFFNDNYVETCLFLEEIALKDPAEKEKYFRKLEQHLDSFPASCIKYKILPHLVNALDLGTASSRVLAPLLKIAKQLSTEEYAQKVLPSLVKWFASNDRAFRSGLLQNLEHFVEYLPNNIVDEQIFSNVSTGFMDTSPGLRELTIKSMLFLVPKLSDKTINTQMLKYFAKLQMDEEPGIRTNTTICLAKIAGHLSHATRQKILVAAFCRAVKDPYPRARVAGVMSFIVTQNYYTKEDIALKIVPNLAACTIDPEKEVREGAFQALSDFVKKLKVISETGKEENIAEGTMVQPGVLGWALNSLSKKIYGGESNGQPAAAGAVQKGGVATPEPQHAAQVKPNPPTAKSPTTRSTTSLPAKKSDQPLDGWGDDDDFDDFEEKPKKAPKKLSTAKAVKTTSPGWEDDDEFSEFGEKTKKPSASTVKANTSGWGDDDFDDFDDKQKKDSRKPAAPSKKPATSSGWGDDEDLDFDEKKAGKKPAKIEKGGWDDDEDWEEFQVVSKPTKLEGQRKTAKKH